jgi:hypothetical protein
MTFNTETFFQAYVACALWASVDEAGEPLDGRDDEIAEETRAQMRADCEAFCESNREALAGLDAGQCGHDFWLSRNGHGAGFWDRGYGELGNRLHKCAEAFGGAHLYEGDDGQLYI